MATSAPAVVAFDGVTCRYGDVLAVDDVTLELPEGLLVGVVGPSGSGKTTIVRTMRGAVSPAAGTVKVFGHDPKRLPQRDRRRLGYMPQHFSLYPDLTAEENVDFVASLFGLLFPKRRRRTREVLRAVDLYDVRGRRAERLSGGMQRRLQLAATLVHEPSLLLLDEPTAGLDPLLRARVWEELRRLRDEGRTILVTTQYVGEAEECELVALIVEGRLAALGTPEDLRSQAIGGELLVVETSRELGLDEWRDVPEVERVEAIGPRRVRLTVSSAARALPLIVERLSARDTNVVEASEERPSFDDVFAALVHRINRDGDLATPGTPAAAVGATEQPRVDEEAAGATAQPVVDETAPQPVVAPTDETAPPPVVDPAGARPLPPPPPGDSGAPVNGQVPPTSGAPNDGQPVGPQAQAFEGQPVGPGVQPFEGQPVGPGVQPFDGQPVGPGVQPFDGQPVGPGVQPGDGPLGDNGQPAASDGGAAADARAASGAARRPQP